MNKQRRTKLAEILNKIEKIKSELYDVLIEEEIAFDNMPENLQCSMRGEDSEEAIEYMENAIANLSEAISELSNI